MYISCRHIKKPEFYRLRFFMYLGRAFKRLTAKYVTAILPSDGKRVATAPCNHWVVQPL